jgi:phage terminase large subunit-like protein
LLEVGADTSSNLEARWAFSWVLQAQRLNGSGRSRSKLDAIMPRTEPEVRKKQKRSDIIIEWIETACRIPEGKDVGKKVKLRAFQKADIRKIYDNPAGTRRGIISYGRKNAKTTTAAFLVLVHLAGPEAVRNGQLYSDAQSRDQAAILYALAAKIVRMSPILAPEIKCLDSQKTMHCEEFGTTYKALSAEATTAYGLSPSFCVHDELGQVRGPRDELFEAIESAMGAQANPLSVIISTQAPTDADLLSILIDDALAGHDPHTVVSLYTAPMDDDPFTEETIRKANPAFGDFLNAKEVMSMAADAKRMPAREASYRNLILNQRVEAKSPFVTRSRWMACAAEPKPLVACDVYAGLDLSSVTDLTAYVEIGNVEQVWQVHPTFWLPAEGLSAKARADHVPYDMWAQHGWLQTCPGNTVSYQYVAAFLKTRFDRLNASQISARRQRLASHRLIFRRLRLDHRSIRCVMSTRLRHDAPPCVTPASRAIFSPPSRVSPLRQC